MTQPFIGQPATRKIGNASAIKTVPAITGMKTCGAGRGLVTAVVK